VDLAALCAKRLQWVKWEECLWKAIEVDPNCYEARRQLGFVKVGSEWLQADEVEARENKTKRDQGLVYYGTGWFPAAQVQAVRETERKKVGWDFLEKVETKFVTVYSSETLEATQQSAVVCQNTGAAYWDLYEKVFKLKLPPPLKVFIFKDNATYGAVIQKTAKISPPGGGNVGLYSSGSQILYVRTDMNAAMGDAKAHLGTMAHEMIHALDDRIANVMRGPPSWLIEGRAEHLGTYGRRDRIVLPGFIHMEPNTAAVQALSGAIKNLSLEALMARKGGFEFTSYCTSFALIHFLFHGAGGKHADGFRRFLAGLPSKATTKDFETCVGELDKIQAEYKLYVQDFLLPAMQSAQSASKRVKR